MERTPGAYPFSPKHLRRLEDVFRLAENAEAQCLIGPLAECNEKIIGAHSVQKAKLRMIADEYDKVYILTSDVVKSITMKSANEYKREDEFLQYRSINSKMLARKWACSYHDNKTFALIEKNSIDLNDEEHCLLLAHRAMTYECFAKRVMHRFYVEKSSEFPSVQSNLEIIVHAGRRDLAMEFHKRIRQSVLDFQNGKDSVMDHRYIFIRSRPRIAATLVTTRGGNIVSTKREIEEIERMNILVPAIEIPLIVTVYPEIDKSVALLSFPKGWEEFVRIIMPAFWESDESIASSLLSKTLLEETDNIMISPAAWHAFSKKKQRRIMDQFVLTAPRHIFVPADAEGAELLSEEVISERMYERDPDFIDHSDPKELDLFEN